jgi:hypothetical protein
MVNATPRWLGALPAIVGVTILAAGILLVAGYGVPVGIGVLVGLVIGALGGLIVSFIIVSRHPGSSSGGSLSTAHAFHEGGVVHGDLPFAPPHDLVRGIELGEQVDRSDLVRVVAGGHRAMAGDVEVTVIAAELRAAGALVHVTVDHAPVGVMGAPLATVQVQDDIGTPYEAIGTSSTGSRDRMRYEIRFVPSPPRDATELAIAIDAFSNPFPGGGGPLRGPWLLRVPLRG